MRRRDHERHRCTHMVAEDVLRRSDRIVQMVRTIFMVMVTFFLPMQRSMFHVGQGVHRRAGARHGNRLPEHGKQHDEEDGGAAHEGASLTKHVATCGTAGLELTGGRLLSRPQLCAMRAPSIDAVRHYRVTGLLPVSKTPC